jgi:serpin B
MSYPSGASGRPRPAIPCRAIILAAILAAGCSPAPVTPSATTAPGPAAAPTATPLVVAGSLVSNVARAASPQVPAADQLELSAGNRAFAAGMYRQLSNQAGNLFFSPYSISLALAMVYAGARTDTASQMAQAMHYTLPPERLQAAFNGLDQYLAALDQPPPATQPALPTPAGGGGQRLQLRIANAIWGQQGHAFLPAYLDTLAQNYGAGLRTVDFKAAPEPARLAINDWVSRQTEARIRDLFAPGTIDASTRLALVNAIYFKASWLTPFAATATTNGAFHLLDGRQVNVPMMASGSAASGYLQGDGYQAVGLPYLDGKTMMLVVVPDAGKFEGFQAGLDAERLDSILKGLSGGKVNLTLPRFRLESSFSLNAALAVMGMPAAFETRADFSGMDGQRDLAISAVVHKAFVAVDEKGTEAAAATGVAMTATAILNPPELRVDRPFIFLICERERGTILFLGRVLDPS